MVNCSDSNAPFIDSFRHPRHRKIFASKIEGSRSIVFYSSHLVNNIQRASNRSKKSCLCHCNQFRFFGHLIHVWSTRKNFSFLSLKTNTVRRDIINYLCYKICWIILQLLTLMLLLYLHWIPGYFTSKLVACPP
jgi:hypothetical protein